MVLGSNPGGGARFSAPVQIDPGAHPASCTVGTVSFLGVKSGRGVTLTPHSFLVSWSWKGRAIPLPTLWTVRPVQSLSACTRVHFTLLYPWSFQNRSMQMLVWPWILRWFRSHLLKINTAMMSETPNAQWSCLRDRRTKAECFCIH